MTREASTRIWDTLVKIGTTLAFLGAAAVINHEVRLSVLEGTQYTRAEAHLAETALEHRITEVAGDIKTILAILKEREEEAK